MGNGSKFYWGCNSVVLENVGNFQFSLYPEYAQSIPISTSKQEHVPFSSARKKICDIIKHQQISHTINWQNLDQN